MATDRNNLASNIDDLNDLMDVYNPDDNNDNPLQMLNIKSNYIHVDNISASAPQGVDFKYKSIHINIQSLPDKHDKLKLFLHRLEQAHVSVDFILLCETFLTERNADLYQIPGYKFVHKSRTSITRGGVGIYIRDHIGFKLRDDIALFCEGEFESIFIETREREKLPSLVKFIGCQTRMSCCH